MTVSYRRCTLAPMSQILNVRVPDELFSRLEAVAADERITRSEVVVDLLNRALSSRDYEVAMLTERVIADRAELFERLA